MRRKHWVLAALALLAALGATGAAVSGAIASSATGQDRTEAHHPSVADTSPAAETRSNPMVLTTTTTTAPPPATSPPVSTLASASPPAESPGTESGAAPSPVLAPDPPPPPALVPEVAPAASACGGSGDAILDAMNADRAANGLGALCDDSQLTGFAQRCANQMAQSGLLTHQDLGGLVGATPFHAMAENILVAPAGTSVVQMEAVWMNSPGHRGNILSGAFAAAGSGVATSTDGRTWACVDFGG